MEVVVKILFSNYAEAFTTADTFLLVDATLARFRVKLDSIFGTVE